ncbi:TonB family protein [Massilia niabensis]|uniref:TonB family protein n=1 Tax=Massilia niabensis TaxID=544910 RepID=A0ABW0L3K1_9BURK
MGAIDAKLLAKFDTCERPEYPERAMKASEDGISLLGFLVGGDGAVVDAVVLNSSGSRHLDRAATLALSKCAFQRPGDIDKAANLWVSVTYIWGCTDDPGMLRAMRAAAVAGGRGNVSARYHLSLLLFSTAKTDADRGKALIVLRSAAELGHAHAQFDLGRRHEIGDGVEANLDEALRWYRKSAEQGDPLAKQRLTLGMLLS